MTIEEFIDNNRDALDECINRVFQQDDRDDDERELWIINDEGLYNWALDEGADL